MEQLSRVSAPKKNARTPKWVVPISVKKKPVHLVCFPFAGGGVGPYRPWAEALSSKYDISAILLPGREQRIMDPPVGSPEEVCNIIAKELLPLHHPHTKFVFFGHSMGSMLAYETALRLRRIYHIHVSMLFASGRKAPHLSLGGNFHKASEQEFIQEIKRMGGTPDILFEDEEMRNLVIPMLRSDYQILETYAPSTIEQLDCPIITCTGDHDTEVSPEEITEWEQLTANAAMHEVFEGDHFYLTDKVQRTKLTSTITHYIQALI